MDPNHIEGRFRKSEAAGDRKLFLLNIVLCVFLGVSGCVCSMSEVLRKGEAFGLLLLLAERTRLQPVIFLNCL